jgi:hypothetical protein
MKIELIREVFNNEGSTLGKLLVDGILFGYTLEDQDRELEEDISKKVYGQSAIPCGTYKVIVTKSNRFKRKLPLLVDVPGFSGVRIHGGNTKNDTLGCPLLGASTDWKRIWNCSGVVDKLTTLIEKSKETVTIEIKRKKPEIV